ncbi:putative polygalacturonase [Naematelia encephala]|uniref:galacturonan 1,4-alpha-galacturonidase n=1 Tax=Naematelia encephala TaxID=71784 RepID=A0A1Y2APH8_9TREE|nr:putative polygalacturonase [Naematelia encephala]
MKAPALLAAALCFPVAWAAALDLGLVILQNQADSALGTLDSHLLHVDPDYNDTLRSSSLRKLCTLYARGSDKDDSDNLLAAVAQCGNGGIIRLPDSKYTIGKPMDITLHHSVLDIHGWLTWTPDIDYWVQNNIPLDFQNLGLAWVIRGHDFVLDGNNAGGIDGNGQVWYTWAAGVSNKPGRPMSMAIVGAKNVVVQNWSIIQPQFWASIVVDSENVLFHNYYVNATTNGSGTVQNTDGSNTYRSSNVTYENMVYQGGDDCIALKPNSSDIVMRNISCHGGMGIAFGSVGQYAGRTDFIENVLIEDVYVGPSTQWPVTTGFYFKSWVGHAIGVPPNGGGGGNGWTKNITVRNFEVDRVRYPIFIQTGLTYLEDERGKHQGSDLFSFSDIHVSNITGTCRGNRLAYLNCAKTSPCSNWTFADFDVQPGKTDHPELAFTCNNFVLGGDDGLNQCHPSNSLLELGPHGDIQYGLQ